MKKTSLLLAVAALLSSSALSVLSVNAAETPADGGNTSGNTSVAEFGVTYTGGALKLNSVPDMYFGSISVENILHDGGTLEYKNKNVSEYKDENGNKLQSGKDTLDVTDSRETIGWKVEASMSYFKDESKNDRLSGELNYVDNKTGKGSIESSKDSAKSVEIASSDSIIHYAGTPTTGTTLKVTPMDNQKLADGKYDATITWNLSNTAADATK